MSMKVSPREINHQDSGSGLQPCLNIRKIGIVSRDYTKKMENDFHDFSSVLSETLHFLDNQGCDSVLFSLFTIANREKYSTLRICKQLRNISAVFYEEYEEKTKNPSKWKVNKNTCVYRQKNGAWGKYSYEQWFGRLAGLRKGFIEDFVKNEIPKRILGNCCILLCGENNGVKYAKTSSKEIEDTFKLRASIPGSARIILNPIHDKMRRFEMKMKRDFLSENKRWTVSVWNKGKVDKNGKIVDGPSPAWTVHYDGHEISSAIENISPIQGIEIGVVDFSSKKLMKYRNEI